MRRYAQDRSRNALHWLAANGLHTCNLRFRGPAILIVLDEPVTHGGRNKTFFGGMTHPIIMSLTIAACPAAPMNKNNAWRRLVDFGRTSKIEHQLIAAARAVLKIVLHFNLG